MRTITQLYLICSIAVSPPRIHVLCRSQRNSEQDRSSTRIHFGYYVDVFATPENLFVSQSQVVLEVPVR